MADDRVHIGQLQLNIAGLSADEAERLGKDVVFWMQQHLPRNVPKKKWAVLDLQVRLPGSLPKNQLAEMIARQICQSLL